MEQTTRIISGVTFITAHVAYSCTNKTQIVSVEMELFFCPGRTRLMFTCMLGRYVASFHSLVSTQTFRRGLTAAVDSCAEIKSVPFSGVTNSCTEFGGKRCSECDVRSVNQSGASACGQQETRAARASSATLYLGGYQYKQVRGGSGGNQGYSSPLHLVEMIVGWLVRTPAPRPGTSTRV